MLMNDIHQHRNLQMILMLVVLYDLTHNREHYEPKENDIDIYTSFVIKIFTVCDAVSLENHIDGCSLSLFNNISFKRE